MPMYTPKIREDLIPRLYRAAKARKVPMTKLVTTLVETALAQVEHELGDLNQLLIADDQPRRRKKHD
jgi:hypothetical protein